MTHARLLALVLAVAAASYALRVLPLALLRRPLRNPRLVAFIERLPYAILAAMVVPDVFSSTGDPLSAAVGFAVALVLALLGRSLPLVAAAATAAAIAVVATTAKTQESNSSVTSWAMQSRYAFSPLLRMISFVAPAISLEQYMPTGVFMKV